MPSGWHEYMQGRYPERVFKAVYPQPTWEEMGRVRGAGSSPSIEMGELEAPRPKHDNCGCGGRVLTGIHCLKWLGDCTEDPVDLGQALLPKTIGIRCSVNLGRQV